MAQKLEKKNIIKISNFNKTSVQSRNGKNIINLSILSSVIKLMDPAIILFPLNNKIIVIFII